MYVYMFLCRLLPMLVVLVLVHPVSALQQEAPPLRAMSMSMMSSFREWMPCALTTHTLRKMVNHVHVWHNDYDSAQGHAS